MNTIHRRDFVKTAAGVGLGIGAACGSSEMATDTAPAGTMYVSLNSQLVKGERLEWPDFARLAARVGFPGVDLNLRAAMEQGVDATRDLLTSLHLKPAVAGLPMNVARGDDAEFRENLKSLPEAAEFAADVGCPRMTMVLSPMSPTPKEEYKKFLGDRIRAVAEILAKPGVRLGMENLGPLQFRMREGNEFIWRVDETVAWGRELAPNVGLLLDVWHWHHAGGTTQDILDAGKERVVTVHFSDAPDLPPEEIRDNERLLPGEGVIDLVGFVQALQQIGYEDGISPEVIGRIPDDMPHEESAKLGLDATLAILQKAGVV